MVSGAIELLVHACSNQDRAIRLAGQENLQKLVKVRWKPSPDTHLASGVMWSPETAGNSPVQTATRSVPRAKESERKCVLIHFIFFLPLLWSEWQCKVAQCRFGCVCCSVSSDKTLSSPWSLSVSAACAAATAGQR